MNQQDAETEVRLLISRFADAAMRDDAAAFHALWTPHCEWKIGEPFPMLARGPDEATRSLAGLMSRWEFFAHLPSSVLVKVRGDEARARCTVEEIAINTAQGTSYHNIAFYFDELRCVDGRWLFQSRSYQYLWLDDKILTGRTFPVPAVPAWPPAA